MSLPVKVTIDLGHFLQGGNTWDRNAREATTAIVTVRLPDGTRQVARGMAIQAPSDYDVWSPKTGEKIALREASRAGIFPKIIEEALFNVWRAEPVGSLQPSQSYRRISRRVWISRNELEKHIRKAEKKGQIVGRPAVP